MEILKVISFAIIALVIIMTLKKEKSEVALFLSIAAGIMIFVFILSKLSIVIDFLYTLSSKANIDIVYLDTVFKILGIAFIATFCSEVCKDAGEGNIAGKVEFAGKILILALAVPILMAVLTSILKIM